MSDTGFGMKFLAGNGDHTYANRAAEMGIKCSGSEKYGHEACTSSAEWACWYRNCGGLYTYRCTACLTVELVATKGDPKMQPLVIKHADEAWPLR